VVSDREAGDYFLDTSPQSQVHRRILLHHGVLAACDYGEESRMAEVSSNGM
jgi:hypothetical protein